jgi:hypothetical protein
MEVIKEFGRFLWARKKLWLIPVVIFSLLLGMLVFFAKGSAVAPFIYTIF